MHTSTPVKDAVHSHSSPQAVSQAKPLIRAFDLINLGIDFEAYRGEVGCGQAAALALRVLVALEQEGCGVAVPESAVRGHGDSFLRGRARRGAGA